MKLLCVLTAPCNAQWVSSVHKTLNVFVCWNVVCMFECGLCSIFARAHFTNESLPTISARLIRVNDCNLYGHKWSEGCIFGSVWIDNSSTPQIFPTSLVLLLPVDDSAAISSITLSAAATRPSLKKYLLLRGPIFQTTHFCKTLDKFKYPSEE